ncbi:hypothetical protein VTN77DRAFT_30 [Rasamsonia byssochlamydoides]|uniref:uncharacterized protein n=1 Tax=Rasamsonia byssochlamydoides TaxID=89139 RepID=UPI003742AD88
MASFKDSSVSRPFAQTGTTIRQTNSRHNSHSLSLGAVNANHRVTRRKSMTSTAAANAAAAVAASLKEYGESAAIPVAASHRRGLSGRKGMESSSMGTSSGFSSYLSRSVNGDSTSGRKHSPSSTDENTAVDGSGPVGRPVSTKNRNRRASEGSHLVRGEGKRVSTELRCEQCGKGYKHSSCLSKHMWEHDPAWAFTSKLLISKHQQVQLLEAATVLVNMNQDSSSAAGEPRDIESDHSSASPAASSELRDGTSSTETTPPPMDDEMTDSDKRYSVNGSSAFSRSFQSVPSSSYNGSGPLHSPAFSHFRQSSVDTRPSTAGTTTMDDDDSDLAAATRLCNLGTPRSKPVAMSPDVPPVPPLPARYLGQNGANTASGSLGLELAGSTSTIFNSFTLDPSLSYKVSDERDVKMGDADRESRHRRNNDVDFGSRQSHVDDDDDGVFGRMEE